MKHPHSRCELGIPALEIASELDVSVRTVESPHESRAPEDRPERTHAAGALGSRAPPWPARARLTFSQPRLHAGTDPRVARPLGCARCPTRSGQPSWCPEFVIPEDTDAEVVATGTAKVATTDEVDASLAVRLSLTGSFGTSRVALSYSWTWRRSRTPR